MADYVIVGAGAAGCVLAEGLSADGRHSVVLLEAGPPNDRVEMVVPATYPLLFGTRYDWGYLSETQPGLGGRRVPWPRGRTLGGSSSINAQVWTRGFPGDYEGWLAGSGTGWGHDDIVATFERTECRPGSDGPGSGPVRLEPLRDPSPATGDFLAACAGAGLGAPADMSRGDRAGCGLATVTQHHGRRWSMADAYLRPARRRPNLAVHTGARARRIVFDGARATGVEYQTAKGRVETAAADAEVIVSAGTVASPHLLMLSGVGDPDALAAAGIEARVDAPGVGRNLADHLVVPLTFATRRPVAPVVDSDAIGSYLRSRRGPLSSNLAEGLAFTGSAPGLDAPDLELLWMPAPFFGSTAAENGGVTLGVVLLAPASRGTVGLAAGDPHGAPVVDPGYLTDPDSADLRALTAGVRLAADILRREPLAGWLRQPRTAGYPLDGNASAAALIRGAAQTLFHPIGTCRMGGDSASVVDARFRLRGATGLRVVDASTVPRPPRGHTQAPTVLLALRAVDLIREGA